jgi:hypothetical protein
LDKEDEERIQMLKNLKLVCVQLINLLRSRQPKYYTFFHYIAKNKATIGLYFYKKTIHIHFDYPYGLTFIFNHKGEQINKGKRQRLDEAFTPQKILVYYYYAVKEAIVNIV